MRKAEYWAKSRYQGDVADSYEEERASTKRWMREQEIVSVLLSGMSPGDSVLDIPVGTGRFLDVCSSRQLVVQGLDISADMLNIASKEADILNARVSLMQGDAQELPLRTSSVDYVLSIRFLNWIPDSVFSRVCKEVARVSRKGAIFQIRVVEQSIRGMAYRLARTMLRHPASLLSDEVNAPKGCLLSKKGSTERRCSRPTSRGRLHGPRRDWQASFRRAKKGLTKLIRVYSQGLFGKEGGNRYLYHVNHVIETMREAGLQVETRVLLDVCDSNVEWVRKPVYFFVLRKTD